METALGEYLAEAPVFVRTFSGTITYWTAGAANFYGYSWEEAIGHSSHALLETEFPVPLADINAHLLKHRVWDGLLRHCRKDGATIWSQSHWRLKGEERDPSHLIVIETNVDVTQREVLSRELNHRVNNNLAIVRALIQLSLRACDQEAVKTLDSRLEALARANRMLLSHHWEYGELGEVVDQVVSAFAANDRVTVAGEYVPLKPSSVFAYILAIHELMTNAFKYGSLSVPEGKVELKWSLSGEKNDRIHLIWRESGGPRVKPPEHAGFGSKLMTKLLRAELGDAPMTLDFHPEGLVAAIDGPVQKTPFGRT